MSSETLDQTNTVALFRQVFPQFAYFSYIQELRKQLRGCTSCLEIGCGVDSPATYVPFDRYVGIDGHAPAIEHRQKYKKRGEYACANAEAVRAMFKEKEFDCVIALDVIEHLTKENGLQLLKDMEYFAKTKILIFTPNGFHPQQSHDGDLQEHLSGWEAGEMRALGFDVIGMHGPLKLRGEYHVPRIRPRALGGLICQVGQLYTRHVPSKAAAILCVKSV